MPSLGLIMILCNEEQNLKRSLKPVAPLFDEVVVVDTGSSDSTVETARSMGASVYNMKWSDDFSAARNLSIKKANADYLFWLDGDNAITAQDAARLRSALESETRGFIGWCREVLVPRGGSLIQKRLFPRRPDIFFKGRIHEQLVHPDSLKFVYLKVNILHWGYQDPKAAKAKGLRNLKILSESLRLNPDDFFLLYQKGKTLFNLRKYPEAGTCLAEALKSGAGLADNPELEAHARILLGLARERLGDENIADLFETAIESNPLAKKMALFHLGRIKAERAEPAAAIDHLAAFLAEPDNYLTLDLDIRKMTFQALMLLARLYRDQGMPEKSVSVLYCAVESEPENPIPRRELIEALLSLGQKRDAEKALAGLAAVNPEDRALNRLKRMTTLEPATKPGHLYCPGKT